MRLLQQEDNTSAIIIFKGYTTVVNDKRPENDVFAKIAVQRLESRSQDLSEPKPLPVPKELLPLSKAAKPQGFKPQKKMTTPGQLETELKRMRRQYAKYMNDAAPALPCGRITLPLDRFNWRIQTEEDLKEFTTVLDGKGKWEKVTIPHYGEPLGRAVTYYRTNFNITRKMLDKGAIFACFDGVDYKAHVFINNAYVGSHEGFFAPFEFEFTQQARLGKNTIVIKVENDVPMGGFCAPDGQGSGDKIYAATGCGYDDPEMGWHHCPPGMGIYQNVRIEARSQLFIRDIFVRPNPDENNAQAWIEIGNCGVMDKSVSFKLSLFGQNFRKTVFKDLNYNPQTTQIRGHGDLDQFTDLCVDNLMGPGINYLRVPIEIPGHRKWETDQPWLYQLQVNLLNDKKEIIDNAKQQFGMRTFVQDEKSNPKGKFFLNSREIRLRGANTMGHLQRCVMRNDLDQLRDDILLAKICNMNFLRLTQRPVQKKIYEYCDRLGMMTQTDLPMFGVLCRDQLIEAVRQSEEMERLIRPHPCSIMVSYINEPYPNATGKPHRYLIRQELEDFFEMASKIIRQANPDRVIKYCDGDYDPPAPAGMPDNHCYCGWYIGHGLDMGKLNRGYWIPIKRNWHYGCGEFGAEGLEAYNTMKKYYPKKWLPKSTDAPWLPGDIVKAQSERFHYLWYETPKTVQQWIDASQDHQAWVVRMMTEAFRRDSRMNTFAIHLFIDAWPAGWMKTIMDVDRQPKKSFFAYQDVLTPLMVSLRSDRTSYFDSESINVEAWICNDLNEQPPGAKLIYQLEINGKTLQAGKCKADIPVCGSTAQGIISFHLPAVTKRSPATVRLALIDRNGKVLHDTSVDFAVFPKLESKQDVRFYVPQGPKSMAANLARQLHGKCFYKGIPTLNDVIVISGSDLSKKQDADVNKAVQTGATAVYLELQPGSYNIAGCKIQVNKCGMGDRHFVSRATGHMLVEGFEANDFKFWHDSSVGFPTPILESVVDAKGFDVILQSGNGDWKSDWHHVPVVLEKLKGKGIVRICQVKLLDRLEHNPTARLFAERLFSIKQ